MPPREKDIDLSTALRTSWRARFLASSLHHIPLKWSLIQGGLLLLLAFGTTALLQRSQVIEESKRIVSRARSLAELVALAAGPDLTFADSPRLLRILECATRDGSLAAVALVDQEGNIVAHTDVTRTGGHIAETPLDASGIHPPSSEVAQALFGEAAGKVLLHPLIGSEGASGMVALVLPGPPRTNFMGHGMRFFLPAGLLLLAFVVISQTTVRRAVKPAADFLERLTAALDLGGERRAGEAAVGSEPASLRGPGEAMDETVHRIHALTRLRDELIIKSRLVDYEKKRMEMILDAFPDGLAVINSVDEIVFMNRGAMRTFGLKCRRQDVKSLRDIPDFQRLARETVKTGQKVVPHTINGAEHQILFARVPLALSEGADMHVLFSMRDVTAQQAAQRTQADFLSQISHELKAPLNTIVTFVEELAENPDSNPAERKDFCNILTGETNRMAQLISNLLQLSRIQLGSLSVQFRFLKPSNLVRTQVESLRGQAEARKLDLQVEVPENLPSMNGDKDLLAVAIGNLLTNAIKYTPGGGKVMVKASQADEGIVIKVTDSGIGISAEDRPKIFERFYRSQDARVQEQPGSGLGLAIVKEIVEIHDGKVTVDSDPGKGSRFRIWLPAREVGDRLDVMEAVHEPSARGG